VCPSVDSEINVEIRLRRNMLQAESISIPLPWLHGESWVGAVPESCSSVRCMWTLGGCQVPDEACGAGNVGTCSYDSIGHIGCSLPTCEGEHEQLRHARWNQGSHTLDLTLSKDMSAGRRIRAVIPRTRALTYPRSTVPPRTAIGHVPLLHTLPLNDVQPSALLPDFGSTYGIQTSSWICVQCYLYVMRAWHARMVPTAPSKREGVFIVDTDYLYANITNVSATMSFAMFFVS
jgi:hypothetical protein